MFQFFKCIEIKLNSNDPLIDESNGKPANNLYFECFDASKQSIQEELPSKAPTNLFELITWLSPAFNTLENYVQHQSNRLKGKKNLKIQHLHFVNKSTCTLSKQETETHAIKNQTIISINSVVSSPIPVESTYLLNNKWIKDNNDNIAIGLDNDEYKQIMDNNTTVGSIKYDFSSNSNDEHDIAISDIYNLSDDDDDKQIEENSYRQTNRITIDEKDEKYNSDMDDSVSSSLSISLSSIYNLSPQEFGILLSSQFENQMRKCRVAQLLMLNIFELYIPHGLLRDIINEIVLFELGMNDITQFTINFLNKEISIGYSSYIGYILGCYESISMCIVVIMHLCDHYSSSYGSGSTIILIFRLIVLLWSISLLIHIFIGVILWKRGHNIAHRLKKLKIAMRVACGLQLNKFHIGEAFSRLHRWCNLRVVRLNDKFNSLKILMIVLQKYILPLSISLCILIDPTGRKWYSYITILAYYLHLHILYEIFHNERHAMVAFARVTLFWGIFISIVAAIASATGSNNNSASSEANFLAGLAGLLLFGIFIAVFDICWFFSDNPAKKRLIFFVILVNFCYIGGCLYMFNISMILISLFFSVSLFHCQIVFNQIVDCVLYGDVDQYLDLDIPTNFFKNTYYQSVIGMTANPNSLD